MTKPHPITPPPELVQQWRFDYLSSNRAFIDVAKEIAQWGADQELDACCAEVLWQEDKALAAKLRDRRRPKPPSLKEQALADLHEIYTSQPFPVGDKRFNRIRRALEALND